MPKPPPLSFRPVSHRRVEHPAAAALAQKGAARVATKSTLVHFPLALYQKLRLSAIAKDISLRELTRTTLEAWVKEDVGAPVKAEIPLAGERGKEVKAFNVYLAPEIHLALKQAAVMRGITLRRLVLAVLQEWARTQAHL